MSDQTATVRPPESQPQPASSSTSVSDTGNAASSQTTTANQPARSQTSRPHQTATVSVGPVRSDMPTSTAPAAPEGEERSQTSGGGDRSENVPETQLVTNDQKPQDMAVTQVRINTFEGWPLNTSHPKEEMAEAGFYYTGHADQVRCFHCKGGLSKWESTEQPWIEHCRWFPYCLHIERCKGQKFVKAVQKLNDPAARATITEEDVIRELLRMEEGESGICGIEMPSPTTTVAQPQPSNNGTGFFSLTTTANQPASRPHQTATVSAGPVTSGGTAREAPQSTAPGSEGEDRSQTSGNGGGTDSSGRSENGTKRQKTRLLTSGLAPRLHISPTKKKTMPLQMAGFFYPDAEQPPEQSPESREQPERMRMSRLKGRLQSFPAQRDDEGRIAELAEAGFYYVDQEKAVKCFCCGGRLENWISGDDPWIEHSRLFPECKFVIKKKGQPYVDAVQRICKPSENLEEQHWIARGNQTVAGQTQAERETNAIHGECLPCNAAPRRAPTTNKKESGQNDSSSAAQRPRQSSANSEAVYGGRSSAMGQHLVHETPLSSLAPAEALPLIAASQRGGNKKQDNRQPQVPNKDRQGLYTTAKGSASNLSHLRRPIQQTHAAEATPISSDAEISVSLASQVQATYSWSEGQVIAQETEGHAGSSSTARPAYSVTTEEPAKDRSAAGYVNGEGRPWMLTLSQPVEEQHDNQQLGEEELSDDDSQVDQAEDDGGIADISLIEGRLCLHCKRWEREVWLTCGHWFLCGSCFFCPQFWRWHLDDHHVPICLVCQEPFEDVEIPRQVVISSRNRRRTGRCSCYQRKG